MSQKFTIHFALLLSSSVLVQVNALAQPAFQSQHCFQVGDNSAVGFSVYMESFDDLLAQTGSDYTWDFSDAGWTEPTVPYLFQPGSASAHLPFVNSEINEYAEISFGRDLFFTYSDDQDTLYYDGLYAGANYPSTPHLPYLNFPMNFGDSVFHYQQLQASPGNPTITGSSTRYWIYDGFGTVQLPYGVAENCYRLRTNQTDSTYIVNIASTNNELIWFRQSDGIPVLRIVSNGFVVSAYYASATGSIDVSEKGNLDMSAYPVPFNDKLNLSAPLNSTFTITDQVGHEMMRACYKGVPVDTDNWPAGCYYIHTMSNDGKVLTARAVKR